MAARSISWLLGLDRIESVDRVRAALSAEWATQRSGPFWFCLCLVAIALLVYAFYWKYQQQGSRRVRTLLASIRAALLILLLVTLAEPILRVTVSRLEPPRLFIVFDGTASMGLRDQYEPQQLAALTESTGLNSASRQEQLVPTRQDYVAAWLSQKAESETRDALLAHIGAPGRCQLQAFIFDGQTDSRVRELTIEETPYERIDWEQVATQLSNTGQVTALGTVLRDLGRQGGRHRLAGVLVVSDFVQNAGAHPLGSADPSLKGPLEELGVPLFAVGVGATRSRDIAVQLQPETKIRRGEKTVVRVRVRQTELQGETVQVRLLAQPRSTDAAATAPIVVDTQDLKLQKDEHLIEMPFLPEHAGEVELRAEVTNIAGEVVTENNRSIRRIQVIDDFIRLLYVAYEPTWEWRFVKEVFHRDPAVGLRGFRTYLASSDPRVRQSNPLFLPTLSQKPKEFFANDVVFLDDIPGSALTPRFCSMLEQFVRDLGGGLVVIAGPRFGPRQLADTPLARMLPVIIDPNAKLQDQREFALELSSRASEFPFMQLDEDPERNQLAWANLGQLPWYQPVANKHERAIVLAQHPTELCLDGSTPQPLIAIRRYGAGEVVYLGFNETWRLRRKYGEKYYRNFWLPMIDRLGLSHALGARKRFVVRMDRRQYRIEDEAIVTVQAYDENYQPLESGSIEGEALSAELVRLTEAGETELIDTLRIGALRAGVYETRFPVLAEGRYQVRVKDPVTKTFSQQQFGVTGASAEMRSSVRNDVLPSQFARRSGGASCALHEADSLVDQIDLAPYRESEDHIYAIWKTPLWFILIVSLMLGEWSLRKWVNLV